MLLILLQTICIKYCNPIMYAGHVSAVRAVVNNIVPGTKEQYY